MSLESPYLNLLSKILNEGSKRDDRTQTGTISLFGEMMKFDLRQGFPLLTTKKVNFNTIKRELLWFISGSTDSTVLEEQGINIWKGNSSKEFLEKRALDYPEGEIGPGYGHQWRNCGGAYPKDDDKPGVDQLKSVIESIKNNPESRRHIVSSWDVCNVDKMALPPCHCLFQFYVDNGFLDCILYQRSGDMFLGVPFNIASYSLLMLLVANICGLEARIFTHVIADAHIYLNHIEQVKKQLSRAPFNPPKVILSEQIGKNIDEIKPEHIVLVDYESHGYIKAEMAV